ncbi:MAG: type II toxin-antitoxin system RelE/ParE family toxin [Armatimonadetes bacterium]|nr:type II toxin-antitoxin system RelE/ParE family toxin [Armatimonadota bacterium]
MPFEIQFVLDAEEDLDKIRPFHRRQILDAIEAHLSDAPEQISRARIKRLRSVTSPAYRLRVGEYRVFYDVDGSEQMVTVLRVLSKEQSMSYLGGLSDEEGSSRET